MYQVACNVCGVVEPGVFEAWWGRDREFHLKWLLCDACRDSLGPVYYLASGTDGKRRPKKAYLAGPMTGNPGFYKWFGVRAKAWRTAGWFVFNPAELEPGLEADTSIPWSYYMRRDIPFLLGSDAILLHPDWRRSRGAVLEVTIADELEIPAHNADDPPSLTPLVLNIDVDPALRARGSE